MKMVNLLKLAEPFIISVFERVFHIFITSLSRAIFHISIPLSKMPKFLINPSFFDKVNFHVLQGA